MTASTAFDIDLSRLIAGGMLVNSLMLVLLAVSHWGALDGFLARRTRLKRAFDMTMLVLRPALLGIGCGMILAALVLRFRA